MSEQETLSRIELSKKNLEYWQDELIRCEAELEKPKLRHGDYGTGEYKGRTIEWHCDGSAPDGLCLESYGSAFTHVRWFLLKDLTNLRVFGNAGDDLTALAEPLEEFTERGFSHHIHHSDKLHGSIMMGSSCYSIKQLEEYIMNLRRMAATAERARDGKAINDTE